MIFLPLFVRSTSQQSQHRDLESSSLGKPGRKSLQKNIDDFTEGLQAIEDIQENIQRELKSTRMVRKYMS